MTHSKHIRNQEPWQPTIFDPRDEHQRAQLYSLSERIEVLHDSLPLQTEDLARMRTPTAQGGQAREHPEHTDQDDQRWVYFPWSDTLVRLLPPESFRALRASRNLYKLTPEEQQQLGQLSIGIVGLSAGAAVARMLALEGTGEHLKLADFDILELSNMNRLPATVHDIGLPKTVLVARQIMELNPYLRLTPYHEGITPDNVDEFLDGLDIVIDECDSLAVKVLLRERARRLRLPVLMETSDRGMLDVERFDLEPERPILHGLLGEMDARTVAAMSAAQQLGLAARMVGPTTLSTRLAASAMEIGHSINTWPQLGSEVALGGATVATAVRRIGLGLPLSSGRRYVDLERIMTAEPVALTALPAGVESGTAPPSPSVFTTVRSQTQSAHLCTEFAHFVVEHAAMAPSAGNAQPWRFHAQGDRLWVALDNERARTPMGDRQAYLALGAAIENIYIAAASRGHMMDVRLFPDEYPADVLAEITSRRQETPAGELQRLARLVPAVRQRTTCRHPGTGEPLSQLDIHRLNRSARGHEITLELLTDPAHLLSIGQLVSEGDRMRYLSEPLHRDLFSSLRWTESEARRWRDGIHVPLLGMSDPELQHLRVAARADVARFLRDRDGAHALRDGRTLALIGSASAVGMLSAPRDTPECWLHAGRAMQRVWLAATKMKLGFQPVGRLFYMRHLFLEEHSNMFLPRERATLKLLDEQVHRFFPETGQRVPTLMFRLARTATPTGRSLRRPVQDILMLGAPGPERS